MMFELYINGTSVITFLSYYEAFTAYGMAVYNLDYLPPYYPGGNAVEVRLFVPPRLS
jgi:hypothetical protein